MYLSFCVPELGIPSSVDLVCSDPAHLVSSFTNGEIGLFNMETRQLVLSLESNLEPGRFAKLKAAAFRPRSVQFYIGF